ncbi:MAG TPA: hypothetical protein DIU15_09725 [Deltaproteobacteria bacterium]|nr:hypothetical protein [Deltaproteobacteria bacterium]HCP46310.1 hypothetical protein [Deltaproteobacteria bacterium]
MKLSLDSILARLTLVVCLSLPVHGFADDGEDDSGGSGDDTNSGGTDEPDSDLSDSETSYVGAVMLVGQEDVTIEPAVPGEFGELNDMRYAFFVGNTLYAGVEDLHGNTVDLIGEFFWFESSIDRGSDFYVGVFKVRTSPVELDGWRLETGESILYLDATTDLTSQSGSFRWDWSVPFESYGWDSFGSVNLETEYGLGVNAEGSVMTATEESEEGDSVTAEVQSKGYLNSKYSVRTQYQVTLWRWEVMVQGAAGHMSWDMVLNSGDREDQNAYHEFFLVMQTDLEENFTISNLEFGGHLKDPVPLWFDHHSALSAAIPNVVLSRPELPEPEEEAPEEEPEAEDSDDPAPPDEDDGGEWTGEDDEDTTVPPGSGNRGTTWSDAPGSCSAVGVQNKSVKSGPLALGLLILGGVLRRRRTTCSSR